MRLSVLCLIFVNVCSGQHQTSLLWKNLTQGPYGIGFKEVHHHDSSRTFGNRVARPMQIVLWYPTGAKANSSRIQVINYFELDFREVDFSNEETADSLRDVLIKRLTRHGADRVELEKLLQSETFAEFEALPALGSFPVVLFVQGGGRPARSAFLMCEYLASHGFVVATMPHIGTETQQPERGIERYKTQQRDMEQLLEEIERLSFVDVGSLFLMSFSTAAESLFLYQAKNQNVKAIVTLDGTPNMDLLGEFEEFRNDLISVPLLFIKSNHGGKMTIEEASEDRELQAYFPKSPKIGIRMMQLNHPGLLSIGLMEAYVPKLTRFEPIGDAVSAHQILYDCVRFFLTTTVESKTVDSGYFQEIPKESAVITFY